MKWLHLWPVAPVTTQPKTHLRVEFLGLPGSGKTTIARELHEMLAHTQPELIFAPDLLRDEAHTRVRGAAKLWLILSELGRGGTGFDSIRRVLTIRQTHPRDKLRAVFTIATMVSLYAHLQRRGLSAVLDQGILQALWSVQLGAAGNGSDALLAGLLDEAACSGRVHVSVETPRNVCIQRLGARTSKHSRMQGNGRACELHAWETAEFLRRTLLGRLRKAYRRQGVPPAIIVVDGTKAPADTARQIVAGLTQAKPMLASHQTFGR